MKSPVISPHSKMGGVFMALIVLEISDFLKIRIFGHVTQRKPHWKKVDYFHILLTVDLAEP